jgi:hypothetical protein
LWGSQSWLQPAFQPAGRGCKSATEPASAILAILSSDRFGAQAARSGERKLGAAIGGDQPAAEDDLDDELTTHLEFQVKKHAAAPGSSSAAWSK